jgi:hypothetical protein
VNVKKVDGQLSVVSTLRRQAAQIGWDDAARQIALSDGGAGWEERCRMNVPRAERMLDFWHAQEHLVELSQSLWPDGACRERGQNCGAESPGSMNSSR